MKGLTQRVTGLLLYGLGGQWAQAFQGGTSFFRLPMVKGHAPTSSLLRPSTPTSAFSTVSSTVDVAPATYTTPPTSEEYVLDVLFVGTGQSSCLPLLKHVLEGNCPVCMDGLRPGSKDKRNNVSVALIKRRRDAKPGETSQCAVIDCGKTFRDAVMTQFCKHGLKDVTAVVFTHGHADAIGGMDDLRDVQRYEQLDPGVRYISGPIGVYLTGPTFETVRNRFDYLVKEPPYLDKQRLILDRPVSFLEYHVIEDNAEFEAGGIPIRALPVLHGGNYVCLGFDVGRKGEFVYISDVKEIPPTTMAYLKSFSRIKILVLDCLKWTPGNYAHASIVEVLNWVDELKPERVFLVGMGCRIGDHDAANEELARRGYPQVQLAYDGLYLSGFGVPDAA